MGLAALALAACSAPTSEPAPAVATDPVPTTAKASLTPTATPSATPPRGCARLAASLSPAEQAGQVLMSGLPSSGPSSSQRELLARHHVGSVVLLGNTTAGASAVRRVSTQVHGLGGRPDDVRVMLAVDQEGGLVQRLRGSGFAAVPSAERQAGLSPTDLERQARRWGDELDDAGVDANLAPVADVVPSALRHANPPIGDLGRGYGSDADDVASHVGPFVSGMDAAGLATTVKHFPGLGRVRGNTDVTSRVVDGTTTRRDVDLAGFRAAVAARVDMVMISSAYYTEIDSHRAAYSSVVIEQMLRGDLGFSRVVISDDLTATAMQDQAPGDRVLRFLGAGGDLAIMGDPSLIPAAAHAVTDKAESDAGFRAALTQKVTRVLEMKAGRDLADC